MAWGKIWSGWKLFQGDAAVAWGAERFIAESKRGGSQMSSVQLLESWGNLAQQGKNGFCKHVMCRMWKPSIVPMTTSKPKFFLLEASGVSVWRPKPHVFVVAGALPQSLTSLHPGHFCISASQASLNMCHGHLCILGISASHPPEPLHPDMSTSLGISLSQVQRQPSRRAGAQPPCSAGVL